MGRRASLHNLGCKVNAYETEAMEQLLRGAGYEIVPFGERADVCIINTCSVTNVADKKSRQMLHRARAKDPESCVVAVGCYVQAAAEELKKDGAVDILIGNDRKKDLVEILEGYFREKERRKKERREQEGQKKGSADEPRREARSFILDIGKARGYEELRLDRHSLHTRVPVKIQDGCDQFCSYCIIPYTRGRVRSRKIRDVTAEVERLADGGYKEVVLTGIHLSSYGTGLEGVEKGGPALLELLGRIQEIDGIERIRLGSLEPRIVTEDFATSLASMPKVCPHFHLSLQSGCASTLKRMNRHYTPEEYEAVCGHLRKAFAHPAITTDVIVGFPGETEEEFAETKAYLERVGFYEMHVFKYSRREGTRAAVMPDQVPESVKARRSDALLHLGKAMSRRFRESFLGEEIQVLLEEEALIGGRRYMTGHTREYVRAAVAFEELEELGSKKMRAEDRAGDGYGGSRRGGAGQGETVRSQAGQEAVGRGVAGQEETAQSQAVGQAGPDRAAWKGRLVWATGREILTEDILKSQLKNKQVFSSGHPC